MVSSSAGPSLLESFTIPLEQQTRSGSNNNNNGSSSICTTTMTSTTTSTTTVTMNESERSGTDDSLAFSNATSSATGTTRGSSSDGGGDAFFQQKQSTATSRAATPSPMASPYMNASNSMLCRNEMKLSMSQEQEQHDHLHQPYDPYHYPPTAATGGRSDSVVLEDGDLFLGDDGGRRSSNNSTMMMMVMDTDSYDSSKRPSGGPYDIDSLLDTPPSSLHKNSASSCLTPTTLTPPTTTAIYHGNGTRSVTIIPPMTAKNGTHRLTAAPASSSAATSFASSCGGVQTPPTHMGGGSINYNSSVGSNSLQHKPVLYSAIGSLEDASANSFGKIRSQYKENSNRDFDRHSGKLLPPPATKKNNRQYMHARFTIDATEKEISPSHGGEEKKQDGPRSSRKKTTPLISNSSADVPSNKADRIETLKCAETTDPLAILPRPKSTGALGSSAVAATATRESKPKKSRRKPKKVVLDTNNIATTTKSSKKSKKPIEMFRPSCDAYTPRVQKKTIKYKPAEMRTPVQSRHQNMGTLSRPNFRDALRRVAMIIKQHVVKIEQRFEGGRGGGTSDGLFRASMMEAFSEDSFVSPKYKCTMVRLPMARPGMVYGLRKIKEHYKIPTEEEIYDFGHRLFNSVQLSSECSIVCLIYMERLMEVAMVPLVARTWKPIFMCGLLLASKVWQDLSSWNIEFASVYPQFSLDAINRLEIQFLKMIKWDLYISSSLYAKYYFALRSLLEKQDFRMRYNRMVGGVGSVNASDALKVQQRSEMVKEEALLHLSLSM